ncbi:MAG: shikimate dehydrogenase [Candidatus Margulisbacteria bacterium]|jgi:shikimate dehydrogenase|nr:shikimate dehydrogenase [Candidatus Margulisiibacteriota bacterium]
MVKKIYVIGWPVEHSLSPEMHNAAFRALGLDYVYEKLAAPPEELAAVLHKLRQDPDCAGANITIPHKKAAAALADELDRGARECGSVNTLVCRAGRLVGYSADGAGYLAGLRADNIDPGNKNIVLFGNGGAAQSIIPVLRPLAKKLTIVARQDTRPDIGAADIVINATSVGMSPRVDATILPEPELLAQIHSGQIFSDIVYAPRQTLFLKNAAARGAVIHEGWKMLLWQGALAFELFTGQPAPVEIMQKALLEKLQDTLEKGAE